MITRVAVRLGARHTDRGNSLTGTAYWNTREGTAMKDDTRQTDFDVERIARLLVAAGLPSERAQRVAAGFDSGMGDTLEQLFGADDCLLETRGAIVLSVIGAILLRRAGINPVALAPEIAAAAEEWDGILGEGLYGPFFEVAPPAEPRTHV
jgi:hypothetical protein